MNAKKDISGSIAFFMLYPLIAGLVAFTPFGLILLPAMFAFILIKIGNRALRTLVASLSLVVSAVFASYGINQFWMPDMWDSLIVGATVVILLFITASVYSCAVLKGKKFWPCVWYSAAAFFLGCAVVAGLLYFCYGHNVPRTITNIVTNKFDRELVLAASQSSALVSGLAEVGSISEALNNLLPQIAAAAPDQLIAQFADFFYEIVASLAVGFVICMAILEGICVSWGAVLLSRIKKLKFPERLSIGWRKGEPDFIPPYKMVFPKRVISSLVVALIVMWVLQLAGASVSGWLFDTVFTVLMFLFTLLGIFMADFIFKRFKMGKVARSAIILLVIIPFLSSYLFFVGMFDSIFGLRRKVFAKQKKG